MTTRSVGVSKADLGLADIDDLDGNITSHPKDAPDRETPQ